MMRRLTVIILFISFIYLPSDLGATWPVVDISSINTQLFTAKRDLIQQLTLVANQKQQLVNMVRQIRQIDSYLERFGNPGKVDLETLRGLYHLVRELPVSKTTQQLEALLGEHDLFKEDSVYGSVSKEIKVDGEVFGKRATATFKPDLIARKSFEYYHDFKESALHRRSQIDRQLEKALLELNAARTDSEVQKIQGVITTLNAQRAEISKEIELASIEASMRYYQNEVEARIAREVRFQNERAAYRVGVRKSLETFKFPNAPVLFKR